MQADRERNMDRVERPQTQGSASAPASNARSRMANATAS